MKFKKLRRKWRLGGGRGSTESQVPYLCRSCTDAARIDNGREMCKDERRVVERKRDVLRG